MSYKLILEDTDMILNIFFLQNFRKIQKIIQNSLFKKYKNMFLFVCIQPNSKSSHAYFIYKKLNYVFIIVWKKNQLMGILTNLWLSFRIWLKFQKHYKNKFL